MVRISNFFGFCKHRIFLVESRWNGRFIVLITMSTIVFCSLFDGLVLSCCLCRRSSGRIRRGRRWRILDWSLSSIGNLGSRAFSLCLENGYIFEELIQSWRVWTTQKWSDNLSFLTLFFWIFFRRFCLCWQFWFAVVTVSIAVRNGSDWCCQKTGWIESIKVLLIFMFKWLLFFCIHVGC